MFYSKNFLPFRIRTTFCPTFTFELCNNVLCPAQRPSAAHNPTQTHQIATLPPNYCNLYGRDMDCIHSLNRRTKIDRVAMPLLKFHLITFQL